MYPKKKPSNNADKSDSRATPSSRTTSQTNSRLVNSQPNLTNTNGSIIVNLNASNFDANATLAPPQSRHHYHHRTTSSIGLGSYHSSWSVPISPLTGSGLQVNTAACAPASVSNPPNCTADAIPLGASNINATGTEGLPVDLSLPNTHPIIHSNSNMTSASYAIPPPSYYKNAINGGVNPNNYYYGYDSVQPYSYASGSDVLPPPLPQSQTFGENSPISHSGIGHFSVTNDSTTVSAVSGTSPIQQAEARYKHLYEEFRKLSRSRWELVENLTRMRREQQSLQEAFDFYRDKTITMANEKAEVMRAYFSDITILLAIVDRLTDGLVDLRQSIQLNGNALESGITPTVADAANRTTQGKEYNLDSKSNKEAESTDVNFTIPILVDDEQAVARALRPKLRELKWVLEDLEGDFTKVSSPKEEKTYFAEAKIDGNVKNDNSSMPNKCFENVERCYDLREKIPNTCSISSASFRWLLNVFHLNYQQYDATTLLSNSPLLSKDERDVKREKISSMEKYEGGVNVSSFSIENSKESCNHSSNNTPRSNQDKLVQCNIQNIVAAAQRDMSALLKSLDYGLPMNSSGCCGLKLQLQLPQSALNVYPQTHLLGNKNVSKNLNNKSNRNPLNSELINAEEAAPNDSLSKNQGSIFPVLKTFQSDTRSDKVNFKTAEKLVIDVRKGEKD